MQDKRQRKSLSFLQDLSFICRFLKEYLLGAKRFRKLGRCVTIYGSARFKPDHLYYKQAIDLGKALSDHNYTVMTGGGPGIMAAANEGAMLGQKRQSAGCGISATPFEQTNNPYVTVFQQCHFFFARKILLTKFSCAFVALPGGFGTLDELFEMLTLIKTNRISDYPVILFGTEFWQPMLDFINDKMIHHGTVSQEEMSIITVTDSIETVLTTINNFCHE